MMHQGFLSQRQRLQKMLLLSHKKRDKNVAIEMDNREKATPKKYWNGTQSSKEKDRVIFTA